MSECTYTTAGVVWPSLLCLANCSFSVFPVSVSSPFYKADFCSPYELMEREEGGIAVLTDTKVNCDTSGYRATEPVFYTHTHAHTRAYTHTHAHTHTYTYACTHTNACVDTRSRTHAHTHTRTHTQAVSLNPSKKRLSLNSGSELTYDKCLLATGGRPKTLTMFEEVEGVKEHSTVYRTVR